MNFTTFLTSTHRESPLRRHETTRVARAGSRAYDSIAARRRDGAATAVRKIRRRTRRRRRRRRSRSRRLRERRPRGRGCVVPHELRLPRAQPPRVYTAAFQIIRFIDPAESLGAETRPLGAFSSVTQTQPARGDVSGDAVGKARDRNEKYTALSE